MLALMSLIGCASTETVKVPVREVVYCAKLPAKPDYATKKLKKELPIKQKVALVLIEREQRITYEAELEAIILGCSEPKQSKNSIENKPNSSVVKR